MTSVTISEQSAPASARPRLGRMAARILAMEIRHSAFMWVIPLLVVLFIYDPYRTAASYPALWPLRSTAVLSKFWPDMVVFAAGFSAWAGSREGRRGIGDLLAATARPAWARQLLALAGTASWVVGTFLAGVLALYVATSSAATWGGPPVWPIVVGVAGMLAVCAVAFTFGAVFPGRFTAPIVAVGMTIVTLVAFRQAVGDVGGAAGAVGVLSPDGSVPGNDWGLFYPVSVGVPIVQVMFMLGLVLAAVGVLGLSQRAGGVGWRGALSAVAAGGARLRVVAVVLLTAGVAAAVAAFGLAETANVADPNQTLQIPAIDSALASSKPISYTPVCSPAGSGSLRVCVHPAYKSSLASFSGALDQVVAEMSGLPGVPSSAREISMALLPQSIAQDNGTGQVVAGVYEFSLSAVGWNADASTIKGALQPALVHAIIAGTRGEMVTLPDGRQVPVPGTAAQLAVIDGILKVLGSPPYPVPGTDNGPAPPGLATPAQQAQVTAAADRFAALPAATRHAWLAANLAALKAGTITLAQVP